MIDINVNILIYRPIRQVFEFVSTPDNDFQWQYGTLATAQLFEGVNRAGASFRTIGHLMGRRFESTYEVTDFVPGTKYGFKSLSGPLQSQTDYSFEFSGGGTRIASCMQANVVGSFQVDEGVLGKGMKRQLKENFAMLKDLLESRQIPSTGTAPLTGSGRYSRQT